MAVCPTCSKSVYQAEQTIGPGRKLYHKPCLVCQSCRKRLDSFTLLEHDEQPYCKSCHLKLFGTRDLRHANLPQASPPASPTQVSPGSPVRLTPTGNGSFASSLTGPASTSGAAPATPPRAAPQPSFWATRAVTSPSQPALPQRTGTRGGGVVPAPAWDDEDEPSSAGAPMDVDAATDRADRREEREVHEALVGGASSAPPPPATPARPASPAAPQTMRTIPLNLNAARAPYTPRVAHSVRGGDADADADDGRSPSFGAGASGDASSPAATPSRQQPVSSFGTPAARQTPMATGTRYGAALSGGAGQVKTHGTGTASPRWGGETPLCARCNGRVYFAEQVKAVNKTFHKACLRCTECGTTLDSRSLRDHEGTVFCARCYGKNYGPQGGGYALLGKAGG